MIGVSCTDFSSRKFEEVWSEVSKEFSHWEIFSELDHTLSRIAGRFLGSEGSYDMTYSVHAPICDTNIASLSERMREVSVLEMMTTMEYAGAMGIKTVTVHPGLYSMAIRGVEARSVEFAKRSLQILERSSEEYGVELAIENMPSFHAMLGQTVDELEYLLDGTGLKICFDIGHANTTSQIDEFVERFAARMSNIHIHDNNGDRDAHLTLGGGNIDFGSVIARLNGYKGDFIIEAKNMESAVESKRVLSKLLSR